LHRGRGERGRGGRRERGRGGRRERGRGGWRERGVDTCIFVYLYTYIRLT